ncbi:MAG: Oxidoreductase [uncultured Sulfurovum sp.]|uniref:Oxidoreductase n=1 Tax=uncultured Sulfurovum sp. TaxID=269237 RepID=A0A6S6TWR8_9BACT|nr:MAG: Oxidoreductase [uncultured Sulfurovum sp.]
MKHIVLAGATGYLGRYIAKELKSRGYYVTLLVRNKQSFKNKMVIADNVIEGDMRDKQFYKGLFEDVDAVISTVGITRQKDGATYINIDYGVNKLLLDEALDAKVRKFIYTSVLHGENLKHLKICQAKELFVEALQSSNIESTIIRPSGFFSDMEEFIHMAKSGRVYLFGDGKKEANPIDGEDLAKVCVDAINLSDSEINIGGPEIMTHNKMAKIAFNVLDKPIKIMYIPSWIRKSLLWTVQKITDQKTYGSIEFFLTVMSMDMVGSSMVKKH